MINTPSASGAKANHAPSWYAATANPFTPPPRLLDAQRADVCVVGGGYTGLMAALSLAERGLDVVLVEANQIGWGASGRNGGQIITGFNRDHAAITAMVGPDDARHLWNLNREATATLADRVTRHAIDCDLTWGFALAALKPRHLNEARAHHEELCGLGYDKTAFHDADAFRKIVTSPHYLGGMTDQGSGHLHPLNYALGLAEAARAAGARLFVGSPAIGIDHGSPATVHTSDGRVTADHVLIATNAHGTGLEDHDLARWVMPVGTFIIATEPLGADTAAALLPTNVAVSDMNFSLNYFRRSRDHRLLFGGGVSYLGLETPPGLALGMRAKMIRVFPQLRDAKIDHVWGGLVAITVNRMPRVGRIAPNILFAHGFSGHGVALAGFCGTLMAEVVAGQASRFDVFARVPHMRFPFARCHTARTATLALAMLWARLRDAL